MLADVPVGSIGPCSQRSAKENSVIVALTYGPKVDWLQNLRAAGGGWLKIGKERLRISAPVPISTEAGHGPHARTLLDLSSLTWASISLSSHGASMTDRVSSRLRPFGSTVFAEITARAAAAGAINLGQGFPNFDGPEFVKQAAIDAIRAGEGQYAPPNGHPALVAALAEKYRHFPVELVPSQNITVTSGCTEALAATFLGLLEPGDEVILIEPSYDAYPVGLSLAGARPRYLTLRPPDFALDPNQLRALVSPATRAIVVNTPHNPSGSGSQPC